MGESRDSRESQTLNSKTNPKGKKKVYLALEGVDDVERGHGLALGVLGVGDGITDDVLQEHLIGVEGEVR